MSSMESCEWNPIWNDWFTETSSDVRLNACRVRAGNSCGSGSFVGFDDRGSYVLTNAHVVGSRVGTRASFQFDPSVAPSALAGQIVMAAYSSGRIAADWAVCLIPDWRPSIKPAYCSRQRPTGSQRFRTTGSPSCVWPLRHQEDLQLISNNNAGFAVWNKPAIPGQSGSAVWDMLTSLQQLLLTWRTGNGNGAGQPLDFIWQQAKTAIETGTLIGSELPPDAVPLSDNVNPDAVPGFFCETSIRSLPIWYEDIQPPQPDPEDPETPDPQLPVPKAVLVESYRKIRDEATAMLAKLEIASDDTPTTPPEGGPTFGL